ncbi:hypothetical protein DCAR_0208388 [Daucus carota subsp. sativus]|uniref:Uncharacterized protein n=1 Tax=Daucus carota subsp. sativus TaxID=79200 RepID=A0A166EI10_DAUCS|nr:hypothetical protein DCAR_0208388 [Daucus carota subsp. sativus]
MQREAEQERFMAADEDGCATPKHCLTPARLVCPPPPKKKKYAGEAARGPPKNGYFKSPDLDLFLAIASAGRTVFNN